MDHEGNKIPINTPNTPEKREDKRPRKDTEHVASSDDYEDYFAPEEEADNVDTQPTKISFWDRINEEGVSKQIQQEFEDNDRVNGQIGVSEYSSSPFEDNVADKDELERRTQSQNPSETQTTSSDTIKGETMSEEPSQLNQPEGSTGEENLPEKNEHKEAGEQLQLKRGEIKQFLKENLSSDSSEEEVDEVYRHIWNRAKEEGKIVLKRGRDFIITEDDKTEETYQKIIKPRLDDLRAELETSKQQELKDSEPFNEFDLQGRIKQGRSAEDIWDEVKLGGLYLSMEGPCYANKGDKWAKFESFKAYRDQDDSKKISSNVSDEQVRDQLRSDFNKVKEEKIESQLNENDNNHSKESSPQLEREEIALDQTPKEQSGEQSEQKSTSEKLTSQQIKELLKKGRKAEKGKQEIYQDIWEQAKDRGVIETLDGGEYRREKTDTGISEYTWYRISPNGSRSQYGYPETRASLKEDNQVPFAYNKFFQNVMKEYEDQPKEQGQEQKRADQPTDIAGEVPESVKELRAQDQKSEKPSERSPHFVNAYKRRLEGLSLEALNTIENTLQTLDDSEVNTERRKLLDTFRENPKAVIRAVLDKGGAEKRSDKMERVFSALKNNTSESQLKKTLSAMNRVESGDSQESQEKPEKAQKISVGDTVQLTEGGREHAVEAIKEIAGDYYVKLEDKRAVRVSEVTTPQKEGGTSEEVQPVDSADSKSFEGGEVKDADIFTKEDMRDVVHNVDSVDQAIDKILKNDKIFWNEDQYAQQQEDGSWSIYSDTVGDKVDEFSQEEMVQQVYGGIIESSEEVRAQIGNFINNVERVVDKIIEALPEDESTEDEERFKGNFRDFQSELVSQTQLLTKGEIKRYRDQFVRLMHKYQDDRPGVWQKSGISYSQDVKKPAQNIDQLLENSS